MAFIKNCDFCSNRVSEWYHSDTCKSKKVIELKPDIFGNECKISRPKCKEVHIDKEKDCPFFERSFISRLAEFKSKICAKMYRLKMKLNEWSGNEGFN